MAEVDHPTGSGPLRAGHDDRERACEDLGRHYAAGRLTMAELEDRQGAAWTARTLDDLRELFDDLPALHHTPQPHQSAPPRRPQHPGPQPPPALPWRGAPPSGGTAWPDPAPPAWPAPAWPAPAWPEVVAPFGHDPRSGRPWSDKQRVPAGVLQLTLGSLGVGRFYTGSVGVGLVQLLLTVLSLGVLLPVTVVWGVIDGIIMLAGSGTDPHGRPLR